MVDVRGPGLIDRDQSPSVDHPKEYVLWDEIAFVPRDVLPLAGISSVFLLADVAEPLLIRVIGLLEPFVDKQSVDARLGCGMNGNEQKGSVAVIVDIGRGLVEGY
jgi:hypothetical protein